MRFSPDYFCNDTIFETEKLWNPTKTLRIINTDPGYQNITCVGYAPSQGRRCRIAIRADNREFITQKLNEMAYFDPNSSEVSSRLRAISGRALCVRFHQNQAANVIGQWHENIRQMKPRSKDRTNGNPIPRAKQQHFHVDDSEEDVKEEWKEMQEFITKFQKELTRERRRNQERAWSDREQARRDREESERDAKRREDIRRGKEREKENERTRKEEQEREEERRKEEEREQEKERKRKEKEEKEEKEEQERKKKAEQAAHNERIRQKAQKKREERERKDRERAEKERSEWDQLWTSYQDRWAKFRSRASTEENIRDLIPWPVKSGSYSDVAEPAVKEFLQMGISREPNASKFMRKECQKWHPDAINSPASWLKGAKLADDDKARVDMICRVANDLLDKAKRESE